MLERCIKAVVGTVLVSGGCLLALAQIVVPLVVVIAAFKIVF
jgi:hypothetical protein